MRWDRSNRGVATLVLGRAWVCVCILCMRAVDRYELASDQASHHSCAAHDRHIEARSHGDGWGGGSLYDGLAQLSAYGGCPSSRSSFDRGGVAKIQAVRELTYRAAASVKQMWREILRRLGRNKSMAEPVLLTMTATKRPYRDARHSVGLPCHTHSNMSAKSATTWGDCFGDIFIVF